MQLHVCKYLINKVVKRNAKRAPLRLTHSCSSGNESSGQQSALSGRQRLRRTALISLVVINVLVLVVVAVDESADAVDAGVKQLRLRFAWLSQSKLFRAINWRRITRLALTKLFFNYINITHIYIYICTMHQSGTVDIQTLAADVCSTASAAATAAPPSPPPLYC